MSQEVLAEIARLSGAIAQHHSATAHAPSTRGSRGRGRGRGSHHYYAPVATHRNSTWIAPGRSLPGSRSGTTTPADGSRSATPAVVSQPLPTPPPPPPPGGFRNKTLVLNRPTTSNAVATADSTSSSAGPSTPKSKPAPPQVVVPAASEVVIDGVTFVAHPRGNKLVRKAVSFTSAPSALPTSLDDSNAGGGGTPKRTSVSGTTYIRTKSGNLVSLDFARKRKDLNEKRAMDAKKERLDRLVGIVKGTQGARDESNLATRGGRGRGRGRGRGGFTRAAPKKSTKLCRFFQKTGQCTRGLTCPYVHSSLTVAICPLFLRGKCPLRASTCLLSHSPSPHRSPHCLHFPSCKNGDACPYAHITVDRDAPVCRSFVEYGWCAKGADCRERHAMECVEFSERGTCSTRGCRLPHVLRRRNGEGEGEDGDDEEDGDAESGLKEGEIDWDAKGKRRAAPDDGEEGEGGKQQWEGISGAAGRRFKKSKQDTASLADNQDFVTISIPYSDDEEFDDEEEAEDDEEFDEDGEDVSSGSEEDNDSDDSEERPSPPLKDTSIASTIVLDEPVEVTAARSESKESGDDD